MHAGFNLFIFVPRKTSCVGVGWTSGLCLCFWCSCCKRSDKALKYYLISGVKTNVVYSKFKPRSIGARLLSFLMGSVLVVVRLPFIAVLFALLFVLDRFVSLVTNASCSLSNP